MKHILYLFLPLLLLGCQSDIMSFEEEQRYHAKSEAAEARVRDCVKRIQWAQEKAEEYQPVLELAESDLAEIRGQVRELRDRNQRAAEEIAKLDEEAKKLEADRKALTDQVAAKKTATAGLRESLKQFAEAEPEAKALLQRLGGEGK